MKSAGHCVDFICPCDNTERVIATEYIELIDTCIFALNMCLRILQEPLINYTFEVHYVHSFSFYC